MYFSITQYLKALKYILNILDNRIPNQCITFVYHNCLISKPVYGCFSDAEPSSYDAIFVGVVGIGVPYNLDLFSTYTTLLTPGGVLVVKTETSAEDELVKLMKTCGLLNVTMSDVRGIVFGHTPSYKVN